MTILLLKHEFYFLIHHPMHKWIRRNLSCFPLGLLKAISISALMGKFLHKSLLQSDHTRIQYSG